VTNHQSFDVKSRRVYLSSVFFKSLLITHRMSRMLVNSHPINPPRQIISPPLPPPELARSSLLRVQPLQVVSSDSGRDITSTHCYGCQTPFPPLKKPQAEVTSIIADAATGTQRFVCPACVNHFCIECDLYCHEVLHNCPGCERMALAADGTHANEPNGSGDLDAMIID
jgi:transcription factor Ssl1